MAALKLFCHWIGINLSSLSKEEIILLDAEFFTQICKELKEIFRNQHKEFFRFMKFTKEMEDDMLETNFVRLIIKDILSTEDYDLKGVACYADTHEDVIQEVIDGRNTNPSATLLRRCIDLHRSVRPDLYHAIVKKISTESLAIA
jgi:hypothetical protein